MDDYFRNLFTPPGLIRFITLEQINNQQTIANKNETVHKLGWNPAARIIITKKEMRRGSNGRLEI